MRKTLVVAIVGALAAGAMVGGATIALAQADVVKERQENRKQTAAAMRAIKGIIDAKGPTAGAVEQAAKLKTLEAAFVKLFPAGSDKGETKALPAIWSDMAGFQAASKTADAAYDKLAVAAGSGDQAALDRRLRRYRQGLRRLPRQVPRQGELIAGARSQRKGGDLRVAAFFFARNKERPVAWGTTGLLSAP